MKKLLIGGAVLALAVPALAQVAPIPATQTPHSIKIQTRTDVQAKVSKHFARMDTNRDGFVTKAEADAAVQAFRGKRAESRGKHDAQWHGQAFERFDANRDGAITRAEWDAAQAQRQQQMADRGANGQPARARMMRGGMGASAGTCSRWPTPTMTAGFHCRKRKRPRSSISIWSTPTATAGSLRMSGCRCISG